MYIKETYFAFGFGTRRTRLSGESDVAVSNQTRTVVVIGAGPSGAAAARALKDAGIDVLVLERSSSVGGRTLTTRFDGFNVDSGAIFVMGSYDRTRAFLRRAGLRGSMQRWIAKTGLRENGQTHGVRFDQPASFLRLPQLTWADRLRLVRVIIGLRLKRGPAPFDLDSLAAADNGETMEAWSRRVLGDSVHEYVVRPLMEPLTGADLGTVSRSFLIGLLRHAHRTQLTVPAGGLDRVTTWQLEGIEVRLNTSVEAIKRSESAVTVLAGGGPIEADYVIVATDAHTAADLCEDVLPEGALSALRGVQAIALHHVAFGFRQDPCPDAPFDLVVPVGQGRHSDVGVLLGGRRVRGSTPDGGQVISVYFDGPRSAELDEQTVGEEAKRVMQDVYGPIEPDFTQIYFRPYGLSTAAPGHYARMVQLYRELPPTLRLAGDYFTHSGIEAACIAGERAAKEVLDGLRAG